MLANAYTSGPDSSWWINRTCSKKDDEGGGGSNAIIAVALLVLHNCRNCCRPCQGYPGSNFAMQVDASGWSLIQNQFRARLHLADTFAKWGNIMDVDYIQTKLWRVLNCCIATAPPRMRFSGCCNIPADVLVPQLESEPSISGVAEVVDPPSSWQCICTNTEGINTFMLALPIIQ